MWGSLRLLLRHTGRTLETLHVWSGPQPRLVTGKDGKASPQSRKPGEFPRDQCHGVPQDTLTSFSAG